MLSALRARPTTDSAQVQSQLHSELHAFNHERFSPRGDSDGWEAQLDRAHAAMRRECTWIEQERAALSSRLRELPSDVDGFMAWFEALAGNGPGQGDPLFPYLATTASRDEMRWFLAQELAGEAGFDDLVALTQVGLPTQAKLELARNYWDEMGRGREVAMHGPMLARLDVELELDRVDAEPVWEALALANLMAGLAHHRQYAYQSVGALGVIELTAPGRCEQVNAGLRRLGIDGAARKYYAVHATVDIKHSLAWNREAIRPLVEADPACMRPIAEGALLRLNAGARCFDRYRSELGLQLRLA